jgi:hypothetical protein
VEYIALDAHKRYSFALIESDVAIEQGLDSTTGKAIACP